MTRSASAKSFSSSATGCEKNFSELAAKFHFQKPFRVVVGGAERQDSVWNGLEALSATAEIVAIQDAARPCTSGELIAATIKAADESGAAVAAQPVTDTIKESADGRFIQRTLDRSRLWTVQTPQTFRVEVIRRALAEARRRKLIFTDDTAACELIGQPVRLVSSVAPNPKVTVPGDLPFIETLLKGRDCDFEPPGHKPFPKTLCPDAFVVDFSPFMKRRLIYGLVMVALVLNLAIGARIYLGSAHAAGKQDAVYPNLELFANVLEKVRKEYVDGQNLTYHDLVYSALKGMVGSLDPHSEFMDADDYQQLQNDTEGQFGGLGLVVSMRDNYVTVVAPMEDTPGFRAGILSGDRIVKIDGKSAEKMSLPDAVKLLRGEPGTQVTVTIQRPSSGMVKDFTLTRAIIKMDMVKDINGKKEFPLGDDKIGYVRITEFGDKAGEELEAALNKLKAQGMKALIIDLRWNPGGLLDEAVEVCGKFLPRGQLVVTTEGRDPSQNSVRRADGHGDEFATGWFPKPMVVLVNLGSASAAEIVTGCLQDLHRAVILGEKTFGKGSVQSIFPLDDGSALKLTTAKYYTPSHKVIHQHGITPDIEVPMTEEQEAALLLKRAPGGLESLSETNRVSIENVHDIQLERAGDLLKGIMLYSERADGARTKVAAK